MSIFVTEANLGSSINVMRSLGSRNIGIIGGDTCKISGGFWSKYCKNRIIYPDPYLEDKYIKSILKAKRQYNFDIIFGMSDSTLRPLVKYKDTIEKSGIILPTPEPEIFFKFCDKFQTYRIAEKAGVPYPETIIVDNYKDALKYSKDLGFPIVLKARALSGGRGLYYIKNRNDLKKNYIKLNKVLAESLLIQEFIPGKKNVYSIPMVFNQNGKVVSSLVLRKIRESPISGGTATFAEVVDSKKLLKNSRDLFKKINLFGIVTPEFKVDPRDGVPKLMEVNPRLFGYTKLAMSAGVDLPFIIYQVAKGNDIPEYYINYNVRFSRLLHDIYIIFKNFTLLNSGWINKLNFLRASLSDYLKKDITFDYIESNDMLPFIFSLLNILLKKIGLMKEPYEVIKKRWY